MINWINSLQDLCNRGKSILAIRQIFEKIISLTEQQNIATIDTIFNLLDPNTLKLEVGLAFLSISTQLQDQLPARSLFFQKMKTYIEQTHSDEETARLLKGL